MPNYAALQDAVTQNNSDEIKELLSAMPIADQAELFNIAIQNNDFLIVDVFLQCDPTLKDNLSTWIDAGTIANYPLNVLAMLVDHGADLIQPVGETTLLELIQQRDKNLGVFLEQETKLLQHLRASMKAQKLELSSKPTSDTRADQAIDFIVTAAHTAKVSNSSKLYTALAIFNELHKNTRPVLTLTKQHYSVDIERVKLINEEVDLAYSLYFELPYHSQHTKNLMTRLKKMGQSFLSQGIESPLIQGLVKITDDYDSIPTLNSQSWLINPTATIKEQANVRLEGIDGQCFGFAYMMMQAMVVGDFISCEKRIEWMRSIPIHELMDRLQTNRELMLLRHHESKKTGLSIQPSNTELDHLELEGYLQAVAFAQNPIFHSDFGINAQDTLKIATVLMSKKLEMEDGLVQINTVTNYYDLATLVTYVHTLRETINTTPPTCAYVPFILHGCNHAIVISYDISKCRWIFCDANAAPPIQHIDNDWLLATKIITALSINNQNTIIKIRADAYGTKNQEKILSAVFEKWKLRPHLRAAHSTQKQHTLYTKMPIFPLGNDSLELALATTNVSLIRIALRGKDINAELINGYTPLMTAIINENMSQVQFLIHEGADVNKSKTITGSKIDDKTGQHKIHSYSPLSDCVDHNTPDIMNLLLDSGALCDVTEMLYELIDRNKIAHFKCFLKKASPVIKATLSHTFMGYIIVMVVPSERRLDYFICDEIQEYLPHWIENKAILDEWLNLLPTEKQALFLQQLPIELLTSWVLSSDQLLDLLKLLPLEKRALFLLQIPIEKISLLIQGSRGVLEKIILILPLEAAALLVHRLFESHYSPLISKANDLEGIISALPTEERFIFLQQEVMLDNLSQWIITENDLYDITIHLPHKQRYLFLQQKWTQSLLMECSSYAYYVGEIIQLLSKEDVVPFLQHCLSEDTLRACISFYLPSILRALPDKEIIPFIQQKIVQDNLEHYFTQERHKDIVDIIACLQKEDIDLFLNQKIILEMLPKWTATPQNFCRMLLVLPSEKISAFIRQRDKTQPEDLRWELHVLVEQLNNKHQDILVECLIGMPHLLQEIDNKQKVYWMVGDSSSKIDQYIFVENLVRVIQRQENTAEGILTRFEQYKDTKDLWLYNNLMRIYQANQKSTQNAACSDLQQHSFFTDGGSSSREEAEKIGVVKAFF